MEPKIEPQRHAGWYDFCKWCVENSVGNPGEHLPKDDWLDWWNCFLAGYNARGGETAEDLR